MFVAAMAILATALPGCSLFNPEAQPDTIRRTEARLAASGFHSIKIDNEDDASYAENLSPFELRQYQATASMVYWYYDPKVCNCVYEGHESEFQRYVGLVRQESDLAQYASESEEEEVASLNGINGGFFPPPVWWIPGVPIPGGHYPGGNPGHHGHHHGHENVASGGGTGKGRSGSSTPTTAGAAHSGGASESGHTGGGGWGGGGESGSHGASSFGSGGFGGWGSGGGSFGAGSFGGGGFGGGGHGH